MRKFYIENSIGERKTLQSNTLFFNEPEGLGYSLDGDYARVGDGFYAETSSYYEQPNIVGDLVFSD